MIDFVVWVLLVVIAILFLVNTILEIRIRRLNDDWRELVMRRLDRLEGGECPAAEGEK